MKSVLQKPLQLSALTLSLLSSINCFADQVFNDDVIITNSLCVGMDCNNGENFNYDTIRLKENNLRIRFVDTSTTGSFPTRDWEITVNESVNGGVNKFSITNIDAGATPFTIMDGAGNNSLFVNSIGNIGIGTSIPAVNLHVVSGNSPALRLEQDQSAGFTAQTWDVSGNETSFFIRDATNGQLPFRIQSGAPNGSIFVASDGDVGFETTTPDGQFDVAHSANLNNHAFLISPTSNVGVNIDNGYQPNALFEVQRTGGNSSLAVQSDGDVGIGTATPTGRFDVRDLGNSTSYFNIDASGNVGIGTNSPSELLDVRDGRISVGGTGSSLKIGTRNNSGGDYYLYSDSGSSLTIWNASNQHIVNIGNNGNLSLGANISNSTPTYPIQHKNGAYLSDGGVWTNASSRELKQNIESLSYEKALAALKALSPVTYEYISEPTESYVGFIAEDVPNLVAMQDRKSLSSMDIIAVLTIIIQHQQTSIENLNKLIK